MSVSIFSYPLRSAAQVCIMVCVPGAARTQALQVNGGNQTLTISTGIAGSEPLSVVNTSCSLRYQLRLRTQKITVSTSCSGQDYNLAVVATNVTKGNAAPEVSLVNGNPETDLVTDIPLGLFSYATCTLNFTASESFSQGNSIELGDDVHTITYTIQAQ